MPSSHIRTAKVWNRIPPTTPTTMTRSSSATQPSVADGSPLTTPASTARPSSQGVSAAGTIHDDAASVMAGTTQP